MGGNRRRLTNSVRLVQQCAVRRRHKVFISPARPREAPAKIGFQVRIAPLGHVRSIRGHVPCFLQRVLNVHKSGGYNPLLQFTTKNGGGGEWGDIRCPGPQRPATRSGRCWRPCTVFLIVHCPCGGGLKGRGGGSGATCHPPLPRPPARDHSTGSPCSFVATAGVLTDPVYHQRANGRGLLPPPLCDIPSGCCFFTGPSTVARSSLRMLRWVAAFCWRRRRLFLLTAFSC